MNTQVGTGKFQDGQIFKERCEDSPGILMFCQGDWWHPTPERVALLEQENYFVLTAANGRMDIPFWLPHPRCIGGLYGHAETVSQMRQQFPGKIVERFEGVGGRFLRNISQDMPNSLHMAGVSFEMTAPHSMKTVDVVSSFSPVPLKRPELLLETLLTSGASAYLFSQSICAYPDKLAELETIARKHQLGIEYFHYPFDPYALIRIGERIVIDSRPIGANAGLGSSYLARARVYLHTSTTEGFSNAIMEALMSDVPVLICEDILGPLQGLSREIPDCIATASPSVTALSSRLTEMIRNAPVAGSIRSAFQAVLDPFAINQRVVRKAQEVFAEQGLPWKGHCPGIFGGNQSRLDISSVSGSQTYRGAMPIYANVEAARQQVAQQATVALRQKRPELLGSLVAEMQILSKL